MKWDSINILIQNIAMKDENIALVKTGDLKNKGDNVHFDSESQRKIGERYAEKYFEITMPAHNNVYSK
jgi:S-adenosylmethionine:tRNA-ribosyltransferase-isomerase (queuine synthetase)